jgi:D-alanyl-D-alanine carboxypeptidase (penicillin-binding protein 5/6)
VKFSPHRWLRRRPLLGLVLGVAVAGSVLASVPALATSNNPFDSSTSTSTSTTTTADGSTTTSTSTTTTTTTTPGPIPKALQLPWPSRASAAVAVPDLSIVASSPVQPTVPVASLTKMMTTWVVLQKLPLTYSKRGPCLIVNANDMALYEHDVETGQSNVKIALGENLCEGQLLRGMLVHSAGDYAQLLTTMLHMSQAQFVAAMNRAARSFGLKRTRYVDYTGISPGDVSTAREQSVIAVELMANEPIVRSIVALTSVKLPVAGVVGSYTPYDGEFGVVGVKSGFTTPAGGCDVMAINVVLNKKVITTYAVVLGVQGANAIDRAGQFALVLAQSIRSKMRVATTPTGTSVQWNGWPGYVVAPTTTTPTTTTTTTSTTTTTTSTPTSTTTTTTTVPPT